MTTTRLDPLGFQHRSFESRAEASADGRTITAIGVPYGVRTELWPGVFEEFLPGSVEDEGAILRYAHREPLGTIAAATDTEAGRQIEARVSATARGDEVLTLVADGVLSRMSIGFYFDDYEEISLPEGGVLYQHKHVKAREYSVVEFPAYDDAKITDLRQSTEIREEKPMTESTITSAQLDALGAQFRQSTEELSREVGLLKTQIATAQSREDTALPFQFRSLGHYLHALAGRSGDEERQMATRAFEGVSVGQSINKPAWLGLLLDRMTLKQPITNMFTHSYDLPATGMTVEYGFRNEDSTVVVARQGVEGEALTEGKSGTYSTQTAPVHTYGGVGTMSLQAIERASENLLDDLLYDQALEYGRRIELQTRALFETTVTTNETTPVLNLTATPTVNEWIEAILALADAYDDTPYLMDGMAVSPTIFLQLALLPKEAKALQFTGTPDDKQGTLTIKTADGNLAGLHVQRVPKWSGKHATGTAREAIRVRESAGAPLRLQDSNVVDLTKVFAVYGYAAHYAPKPGLLKPLTFTKA